MSLPQKSHEKCIMTDGSSRRHGAATSAGEAVARGGWRLSERVKGISAPPESTRILHTSHFHAKLSSGILRTIRPKLTILPLARNSFALGNFFLDLCRLLCLLLPSARQPTAHNLAPSPFASGYTCNSPGIH